MTLSLLELTTHLKSPGNILEISYRPDLGAGNLRKRWGRGRTEHHRGDLWGLFIAGNLCCCLPTKFEINLVSLLGKIILRKEAIDLPEGENVFSWNIKNQNISTGVYFVEISNKENHKIIRKILYIK